jgi:hypothetical protein
MSWIDNFVKAHSEFEAPAVFYHWAGLAALSAVLKDSVYWDKYAYKLYPNIYVMLHADSGMRKSAPISVAKKLVKGVGNTKVISGRSSIQAILKKIATGETVNGSKHILSGTAFIVSSELTSSLVDDPAAMDILTDLYDRNYNEGDWDSLLKMETFAIKSPTVTMLTATNEAHSSELFVRKDVMGGFFARTNIITAETRNVINSLMYKPENPPNYEEDIKYLKEVSHLSGSLQISESNRKFFKDWYHDFIEIVDSQPEKDKTGSLNRFDDTVLKTAILLQLGAQPTMEIGHAALSKAIEICESFIGNMRKVTHGQGKSTWAQEKALIIYELLERDNHTISRKMINKKYWNRANANEWEEIMNSLCTAGICSREMSGAEVIYVMHDVQVAELKRHFKGQLEKRAKGKGKDG